jgi:cobalt/nickel transport system permease protein
MRHVVVDEWSIRDSVLHRRDPRAKALALLLVLIAIAITPLGYGLLLQGAFVFGTAALARLPWAAYLQRTAAVLPFAGVFAAITAFQGDTIRAAGLLVRAWLSVAAILVLVGTTPLPALMHAIGRLGVPQFLTGVVQFVYRYLFLIAEQGWNMRQAGAARAGSLSLRAASGTVTSLFARSYTRAESVHRAMLARGYTGELHASKTRSWTGADTLLLAIAAAPLSVLAL